MYRVYFIGVRNPRYIIIIFLSHYSFCAPIHWPRNDYSNVDPFDPQGKTSRSYILNRSISRAIDGLSHILFYILCVYLRLGNIYNNIIIKSFMTVTCSVGPSEYEISHRTSHIIRWLFRTNSSSVSYWNISKWPNFRHFSFRTIYTNLILRNSRKMT